MKQLITKKGYHELPAILAVLVIVGVLVYYAYSNYFMTPERIYSQSLSKMQELKKAHIEAETTVNLGGAKNLIDLFIGAINPEVSGFKISGDFDVTDSENPKYRLSTEMSQYSRDSFDIENVAIGDMVYYHIDYISGNQSNRELRYYPESWFTQKTKPEIDPSLTVKLASMTPIQEALVSITELPDSNIGKAETYHYALELDNQVFQRNVDKLVEELDLEFENRETLNLIEEMKVTKVEVWIGKSDKYLYKALFEFQSELNGSTVRITTDINLSEFENTEEIVAPEKYIEFAFDPKLDVNERLPETDQVRTRHINYIANAVHEFYKANGILPDNYPTSPACIGTGSSCYDLKQSTSEDSGDYLVPYYISQIPREFYAGVARHDEYHTYTADNKLYVIATDSKGEEILAERVLE